MQYDLEGGNEWIRLHIMIARGVPVEEVQEWKERMRENRERMQKKGKESACIL